MLQSAVDQEDCGFKKQAVEVRTMAGEWWTL